MDYRNLAAALTLRRHAKWRGRRLAGRVSGRQPSRPARVDCSRRPASETPARQRPSAHAVGSQYSGSTTPMNRSLITTTSSALRRTSRRDCVAKPRQRALSCPGLRARCAAQPSGLTAPPIIAGYWQLRDRLSGCSRQAERHLLVSGRQVPFEGRKPVSEGDLMHIAERWVSLSGSMITPRARGWREVRRPIGRETPRRYRGASSV